MRNYNVDEAFQILKEYKITTHKESVRRWLRDGIIKGLSPASRKEGWLIPQKNLFDFIHERIPQNVSPSINTTSDVKKQTKEEIRAEMWRELSRKNIFEDYIEPKKKQVQACIEHKGYSKEFGGYVWENISQHKRGYTTPRIPYLLDAFQFEGERIRFDENYELLEEKILYALIEHLRKKRVGTI